MFTDNQKPIAECNIDGVDVITRLKAEPREDGDKTYRYETILKDGDWSQVEKEYTTQGAALGGHIKFAEMLSESEAV